MSQHPLYLAEVGAALDQAVGQAVPQDIGRGRFESPCQVK
jgi:hypothetical protein